ncbi:MAG: 50S ribosomal protein L10 [Oscillospiraceae bacterium]|nr:50S ribosomal protein L10 [Oscillospiraceae bacterium]
MPSAKVLKEKQAKVAALIELINGSAAGVLVSYKGINVADDTKLRKELREAGVSYSVEKNTLLKRAFAETGLSGLDNVLEGTTAIALSPDDQTAPARILGKYSETNETFQLKAGFIDKELYDQAGVQALSKIPSKDVLLSMLVGSLQGPIQKLAATLKAVQEKKEEEAA